MVIGEILIDRFADRERIGGAAFNFAFHLKHMGWPVCFLTRIGDDANGRKILLKLEQSGFSRESVQIDPHHPTGVVDVCLDDMGIPEFQIRTDAAYDHLDFTRMSRADLSAVQLIYFGTLAQRTPQGCRQIQSLLECIAPSTCAFCDINLRPPHINPEAIEASLHHTDILKLNTQELARIGSILNGPDEAADTSEWLMRSYGISKILLTRGAQGSKVITPGRTIASPSTEVETIVDTVGAGDAFAAVFAAGYLKGLPINRILELASDFAAQICGLAGALPSGKATYGPLRRIMEP